MLRVLLLIVLPVAAVAGAYLAVRPRLRLGRRRGTRGPRPRTVAKRVAPFVVLAVVIGVSFAIVGDTTGTAVSFGVVALLVLAAVADRWWRRRRVVG